MSYRKHFATELKINTMVGRTKTPVPVEKVRRKKTTAEEIFSRMTDDEKIEYISGIDSFGIKAIPRLDLPAIWTTDTTSGVRGWDIDGTVMPAAVAMAASFDRELIYKCARSIADECRGVGVSVLLGPGVNIARTPVCGRNFEYMGEDPYLAGEMASAYIKGAQSQGVVTTVKHFACNNSDYNRHKENVIVDERTLREIYLPAFEKSVKEGGSLGVMTSYNLVNGVYASQNEHLVDDILRGEWGYEGFVISDWTSLYDTVGPIKSGVDLEMPDGKWFSALKIRQALSSGQITMRDIDKKVLRLLKVWERLGILDRPVSEHPEKIGCAENRRNALDMARESITLLKNSEGRLPLKGKGIKKIAMLGYNSEVTPTGGGGSAFIIKPSPNDSLPQELKKRLPDAEIVVLGWDWAKTEANLETVREADAVIYSTGFDKVFESETYDRPYELLEAEAEGIRRAKGLNSNTIVILHSGGDCETRSWVDAVDAVLFAYYLGDEGAPALADVLFGDVNPSGHLPFTIARDEKDYSTMISLPEDSWWIDDQRRGVPGQGDPKVGTITDLEYTEGILVGYRWFDTKSLTVEFPFGHGLSYTTFAYSDARTEVSDGNVLVTFKIRNTGAVKGTEVAQVYVHDMMPCISKADQELRGFERIGLSPGEEKTLSVKLDSRAFSHYDTENGRWHRAAGSYEIRIGSSSRDIRLAAVVEY